jgi:hypothetical protein
MSSCEKYHCSMSPIFLGKSHLEPIQEYTPKMSSMDSLVSRW